MNDKERTTKETDDIAQSIADIRTKTGYGRIVIIMYAGDIQEIETSYKRRPKVERKRISTVAVKAD